MFQEESYFTDVHYDAMYDDIYFYSRYRFETKELVEQFTNQIETKFKNIITSSIGYGKEHFTTGYTDDLLYRPRFLNLKEGLEDLEQMVKYCNNYLLVDKSTYKYHNNIFTHPIKEYDQMFLAKENEKLKKENEEIKKKKYRQYTINSIEKKNYSIEELNKIIEICQNKINELNK